MDSLCLFGLEVVGMGLMSIGAVGFCTVGFKRGVGSLFGDLLVLKSSPSLFRDFWDMLGDCRSCSSEHVSNEQCQI